MSQQEQQSVSHDIFADPQIANAKVDDPLFRFLFENWRLLASVAATVLIGYFAYGSYTKARNANLARSSELYSSMRETFTALEGVQNKIESQKGEVSAEDPLLQEKKELEEKVGHQLSALAETKAPYGELAALYANIVSSRYGLSTKV
ncbi:MAG: hypothetical protein KDD53_00155, partial [Bdellovibrionales bacterium]|nr:hypothetical protein [Bdellovibrionales bacterium]